MKISFFTALSAAVVLVVVAGCSRETQQDARVLANDLKRDVNAAAIKVDAEVERAVN